MYWELLKLVLYVRCNLFLGFYCFNVMCDYILLRLCVHKVKKSMHTFSIKGVLQKAKFNKKKSEIIKNGNNNGLSEVPV